MGQGFPRDRITEKLQKGGGKGNRDQGEEARTRNEAEQIEMERRDFYPQLCKSLVPGFSRYSSLIMLGVETSTRETIIGNYMQQGTVFLVFKA